MRMLWCDFCTKSCETGTDHATSTISCLECGRVLCQDIFTDEVGFEKGAGGESRVAGNYVKSIQSQYSDSFNRTLEKGISEICYLTVRLTEYRNESLIQPASCFYKIAVERGFTRGRRTEHVAASCLYIACRVKRQPYMLIDFSILLTVNVYVLGAVFLQLCKLLSLQEHPTILTLVDPSLFMHRFTKSLMKDGDYLNEVLRTASNIVASMKRDWMQTGRKPSGICGAALYIATLSHGLTYSRSDILKVVHICEATLTKRLIEFEGTTSGSLTTEELNQKAQEYEMENPLSPVAPKGSGTTEVLCKHKQKECFAHGLCRDCYKEFLDIAGGLDGEAEPPAFQRAEMCRLINTSSCQDTGNIANPSSICDEAIYKSNGNDEDTLIPGSTALEKPEMHYSGTFEKSTDDPNMIDENNFSDITDEEVNIYLHTEEERRFKEIIWEYVNKEHIEQEAAKKAAAAAAASKSYDDNPDDVLEAQGTRKKKRQKQASDAKNVGPARTTTGAIKRVFVKKGLGSKINEIELYKLLDESPEQEDVALLKDHTRKEKRKDRDDDIEQEENEEDMTDENNVGDEWCGGEENMYNYDDYDPDNYEGEC